MKNALLLSHSGLYQLSNCEIFSEFVSHLLNSGVDKNEMNL